MVEGEGCGEGCAGARAVGDVCVGGVWDSTGMLLGLYGGKVMGRRMRCMVGLMKGGTEDCI